ncbi:hypothetical protein [Poseidonibacter lekithochrous]|uniref:hypothetical protein n=1 Tax=Poseidonibacter lekithochrous TaxID=1904463 RepID=UPI0008FC66CB|nr:hypothetical protein [Poseidonibacter lekithochrous]
MSTNKTKSKKAYTLLITIVLISLFSYLIISTMQTKSFANKNIQNQYLYIQAKNHMGFFRSHINSMSTEQLKSMNKLELKDDSFKIEANISSDTNSNLQIDIFVKSISFDIRLHERVIR